MLDTNVVIYTIRNRPEEARLMFNRYEGDISISAVTLMELLYGAEKSEQRGAQSTRCGVLRSPVGGAAV